MLALRYSWMLSLIYSSGSWRIDVQSSTVKTLSLKSWHLSWSLSTMELSSRFNEFDLFHKLHFLFFKCNASRVINRFFFCWAFQRQHICWLPLKRIHFRLTECQVVKECPPIHRFYCLAHFNTISLVYIISRFRNVAFRTIAFKIKPKIHVIT